MKEVWIVLSTTAICYLGWAMVLAQVNPFDWSMEQRTGIVFTILILTLLRLAMSSDAKED